jgi:D-xylose reductase
MEELVEKGLARNIGVSNMVAQSVMDLMKYARIKPAVNQIECHPYLVQVLGPDCIDDASGNAGPNPVRCLQESLVWYCQKEGIQITGFSPLGSSSYIQLGMDMGQGTGVLHDPVILAIAARYSKSPAQVVLR